jgi:DNA modification methylase
MYKLRMGDCIEWMSKLKAGSVDLILCDPPYGTTACKWDIVIPFEPMWEQIWRVLKPNGACVLFGKTPFSSILVASQLSTFRYTLIWQKDKGTDFGNVNRKPINAHEDASVFYKAQPTYNRQDTPGKPYFKKNYRNNDGDDLNFKSDNSGEYTNEGSRAPQSVMYFARESATKGKNLHPTQKPVALLEYLIKTYTNEGETVLDFTMGSGSTGVAAVSTNRKFLGIERDEKYFTIAKQRIEEAVCSRISTAQADLLDKSS